jgi:hypothetical protein
LCWWPWRGNITSPTSSQVLRSLETIRVLLGRLPTDSKILSLGPRPHLTTLKLWFNRRELWLCGLITVSLGYPDRFMTLRRGVHFTHTFDQPIPQLQAVLTYKTHTIDRISSAVHRGAPRDGRLIGRGACNQEQEGNRDTWVIQVQAVGTM